jgi:membrane protein DedA with SNARE-associated domain
MSAEFLSSYSWAIYLLVFLGPFVQEDAAVVGAATAYITHQGDPTGLFGATLLGLTLSDSWKYWAGALAYRWRPARKWVRDPRVAGARDQVRRRLGLTLIAARFVPGTRIPLYVACGLFRAPFLRFLALIIFSGALYLALAFGAFALLGAVAGESVRAAAPLVVIAIVVIVVSVKAIDLFVRRPRAGGSADP